MFDRAPPDPRDDIYALACVSYELLTGAHPYKKVAAHKALELGLKPPPVKGLSRRQQKALFKALSLRRQERTSTVEEFRDGIRPAESHARQLAAGGVLILLLAGLFLGVLLYTQSRQDAQTALIQAIQQGDKRQLEELLVRINRLDRNTRDLLLYMLRKEIIGHFQDRINDAINTKARRYDFPEASRLLQEVKRLYPDSASLAEAEQQLKLRKEQLVRTLLQNHREQSVSGQDTSRIMEILREVDPDHVLLKDPGLRKDGS
jgi:serine/threonine protein kinase